MGRTADKLRQAVVDVLGVGAKPRDAIAEELDVRHVEWDRSRFDRLMQRDTSFAEVTDGMIHVPSVLDGTSWTVHVDADDAAGGFVRTHPHLSPLTWWLLEDDVPLVDGAGQTLGTLEVDDEWLDGADTDVLLGPDGWLDELAGSWATVAVERGALRWSHCSTSPSPTDAQVVAMRAGFDRAARHEALEGLDDTPAELRFTAGSGPIYEAVLADRAAFLAAPIPPLPELYRAAGLEERGRILAEAGFDWDALHAWQQRRRFNSFYRLDDEGADQLAVLIGACDRAEDLGADDANRVAELLDAAAVAEAFWTERALGEGSVADVGRFVDAVSAQLGGPLPVGLAWLRARCLDRTGDTAAAIATLEEAGGASSSHEPALVELAGFASDRGDAQEAFRLLQRASVTTLPDDDVEASDGEHLLAEIAPFALHRPRPAARRNDPCPCGSGRKYKACHLGREKHPLDERSLWLYAKARRFLRQHRPEELITVADEMIDPDDGYFLHRDLRASPVVMDLALQHSVFAEFLAARDGLLPDDETLPAAQWALVDPGVFEVERFGAALRAAGLDGDERAWRLERDTPNMPNATVATLRLDGVDLVGEVNSDQRADELRAVVAAALPGADLVADETQSLGELAEDHDPEDAPAPLDQNDPEIRQVIERYILEMEQRWLDEPIPALGGSTPREAAADPIGREQLTQLLGSFPARTPDDPGTFDPDRLRRALDL
jgi:hypothetical protein